MRLRWLLRDRECLVCGGTGMIDHTHENALLSEHLSEDEMRVLRASDQWNNPIRLCDECNGTGRMSAKRHAEITTLADDAIQKFWQTKEKT